MTLSVSKYLSYPQNRLAILLLLESIVITDISALKHSSWHVPSTTGEVPVPREGLGLAILRGHLYVFAGKTGSDGMSGSAPIIIRILV
jgi:hypothetical protein